MALAPQEFPAKLKSVFGVDTEKALSTPLGAASPLWLAFGAAASAGVAYWWFTRWLRPANLEAAPLNAAIDLPAAEPFTAESSLPAPPVIEAAPAVAAEALADAAVEAVAPMAVVEPEAVEIAPPVAPPAEVVKLAPVAAPEAVALPVASAELVTKAAIVKKPRVKATAVIPKAPASATQKAIADKLVAKRAAAKLAASPKVATKAKSPAKGKSR